MKSCSLETRGHAHWSVENPCPLETRDVLEVSHLSRPSNQWESASQLDGAHITKERNMIQIPNLEIDCDSDDPDTQVMLTQDFGGNTSMVTLHPSQVKLLAERMGLLLPDAEAQRTIARLSRQLRVLTERIKYLDEWLHAHSDASNADLSYERAYSFATWELANEFCADLAPVPEAAAPQPAGAAPQQPDQPNPQQSTLLFERKPS